MGSKNVTFNSLKVIKVKVMIVARAFFISYLKSTPSNILVSKSLKTKSWSTASHKKENISAVGILFWQTSTMNPLNKLCRIFFRLKMAKKLFLIVRAWCSLSAISILSIGSIQAMFRLGVSTRLRSTKNVDFSL